MELPRMGQASRLADEGALASLRKQLLTCVRPSATEKERQMCSKWCTSCITQWGQGRRWALSLQLVGDIANAGLQSNVITCSAAVAACERGKRWAAALLMLSHMQRIDVPPQAVAANSAASICARSGLWLHALGVLSNFAHAAVQLTVVSYCTAISAMRMLESWCHAIAALVNCCIAGLVANVFAFNAVLHKQAEAGRWQEAAAVSAQLLRALVQPGLVSVNSAIAGHSTGNSLGTCLGTHASHSSVWSTGRRLHSGRCIGVLRRKRSLALERLATHH
eukprot:TRINITY_DN59760_c0_g1_i1.p1 TRINITY_DN59760_c0_g1~~TRINITY_DN59760_c0_g1_i1.p1  ORF type:complete len:278 (-),score=37.41 TRINITY_DN59760_c0_g1_i1:87-920(-)